MSGNAQQSTAANLLTFTRIGADPAAEPCLHCSGGEGEIFLFRERGQIEWSGYPLHEACFEPWREEYEKHKRVRRAWDDSHNTRDGHLKRDPPPKRPAWLEKRFQERIQYLEACRRGEPETPSERRSYSDIRQRAWEATHPPKPKSNGGGDNVIRLSRDTEQERAVGAIQRETGLDHERATWLYYSRHNYALPEHQQIFCETFEQKLAAATADRLLGSTAPSARQSERATPLSRELKLIPFEDIRFDPTPSHVVKGIIPRNGLVTVWGPPKCGKSFWTFDLSMHVALGWKYRDYKVEQGAVVYCAAEGGPGFGKRIEAWRQRHLAEDHSEPIPFYLLALPLDLIAEHAALIATIEAQANGAPKLVVLDTLNRTLVGSENRPEDMAKYIRAADAVRVAFGCAVIIIHHCGVDGTRPRGHTSLAGADDAQIKVERDQDGNITVTVEHMKDEEPSAPMGSKLEWLQIGLNDVGDPVGSCVIVPADVVPKKKGAGQSGAAKLALEQLQELIADIGEIPPASNHIPPNTKVCSVVAWRESFYNVHAGKPDTKQKAFVRATLKLQEAHLVGIWSDNAWLAGHAGHSRTFEKMSGHDD
jgi:hypothetical protein